MTIDEAIKILDPTTSAEALAEIALRGELSENRTLVTVCEEACLIAVEALRRSRWIPCSERLPEEIVPVNVVWVNHSPPPYYANIKDVPQSGTAIYCDDWYWYSSVCEDLLSEYGVNDADLVEKGIEITHWQPLPELPRKEN